MSKPDPLMLGREAFKDGKPLADNPFAKGSPEEMQWDSGWVYEMQLWEKSGENE